MTMVVPPGAEAFYRDGTECFRWVVTTRYVDLRPLRRRPITSPESLRGRGEPVFDTRRQVPADAWLTSTTELRLVPEG
jgi:hypothetical protein